MDKLNNWLTLLANIGVIAGIIFLAIEVQQNTRAQENASRLESTRVFTDWYTTVMEDPDLVALWAKGNLKPLELTPPEIDRFMWMLSSIGSRIEEAFTQYEAGLLDQEIWAEYRAVMASFLHNPLAKYWWDQRISPFTNRFRKEIEAAVQDTPSWKLPTPIQESEPNDLQVTPNQ